MRAMVLRLRGARLAGKIHIGSRSRFDRPWGIRFGSRVMVEGNAYFKLVHDEATLTIGELVFIGNGCEFDVHEKVAIGAHTLFAPGCFVTDHNHGIESSIRIDQQTCIVSPVTIGSDVWLGTGVTVLPGVTIGDGAVVGARAIVNKNVPAGAIVVGIPARVVGWRSEKSGTSTEDLDAGP
jgi:acetyltransferase-like isoleucine patch superfamily enzyme